MPSKAALEAYAASQARAKEETGGTAGTGTGTGASVVGVGGGGTGGGAVVTAPTTNTPTTASAVPNTKTSTPAKAQLIKAGATFARTKVTENLRHYSLITENNLEDVPQFDLSELQLGKVLGRGGFGVVNEIVGITVNNTNGTNGMKSSTTKDAAGPEGGNNSNNNGDDDEEEGGDAVDVDESRAFIARHCVRSGTGRNGGSAGDARYAIKYLSTEIKSDPATFIQGIMDMNIETQFLAAIHHPNIIKMRAYASGDAFHPDYFIVLDRLYDTLEARLRKWSKKERRSSSFLARKVLDKKGRKRDRLLEVRLAAAFDLSAALEYLHGLHVIYRDLKPENIGFDVRGDVKLFDFGLAKQLNLSDIDSDGTYQLTPDTGSLRYMAPEVLLGKPYNFSIDTFSFSILLWEMLSLGGKPFEGYTPKMHRERVVLGGSRPRMDMTWSNSLRNVMARGWSEVIEVRPMMESVTKVLKKEVARLRGRGGENGDGGGDVSDLQHYQRRSTFVLRPNKKK